MKAQLIRLRRFLGVGGFLFLGLQTLLIVLAVSFGFANLAWIGAIMPVIIFSGLGAALFRAGDEYQRTAAVRGYQHTLFKLIDSQSEFCLVLRPFGRDGMTIVRDMKGVVKGGIGPKKFFRRRANTTMEQIVGRAAREARTLLTYAIVDSGVRVAPPGLVFMSAPHDQWQMVAAHLIARAHTIVLIVPEKSRMDTEGFRWELEQIADFSLQSRVVVVLPPPGRRNRPKRAPVAQARAIIATLSSAMVDDYGVGEPLSDAFPDEAVVVRTSFHTREAKWWVPQRPDRVPGLRRQPRRWYVSSGTYEGALIEAIKDIEAEMSDWSFGARYSV